jgi:hypothetical protein
LGGSVREPGMASIGTPSGVVTGVGLAEGAVPGGVMGEVVMGWGAWARELGRSNTLCRVNRTIALKHPRAIRIDRLRELCFGMMIVRFLMVEVLLKFSLKFSGLKFSFKVND